MSFVDSDPATIMFIIINDYYNNMPFDASIRRHLVGGQTFVIDIVNHPHHQHLDHFVAIPSDSIARNVILKYLELDTFGGIKARGEGSFMTIALLCQRLEWTCVSQKKKLPKHNPDILSCKPLKGN